MTSITLNISDEQLLELQRMAEENKISLEELLERNIENWSNASREELKKATNYVLEKNAELYRRLA